MLGYFLVAASLAIALATGAGPRQIAGYFLEGLLDWSTIQLLGVVTLIEMLTVFLQGNGSLDRMLVALRRVLDDPRGLIGLVPSVLGLFPVPGGAVLSAPMVEKYGDELGIDPDRKASINLFFRHIWDQVFPFKPHLILAAAVLNVPLFTLIGWHLPVTLLGAAAGFVYLVGWGSRPQDGEQSEAIEPGQGAPLWLEVAPLVIPLLLALLLRIDFLYAMAVGLLFGVVTQGVRGGLLGKMIRKGVQPKLLFILASVMVFKTVVDHSGLVQTLATLFTSLGVPIPLLVVALPLAMGVLTGLETAVVAMAFPLLVGMIPDGTPQLPYMLLMMVSNSVGSTLSPAHICMAAGNQYYGARLGRVLALSAPPQVVRLAFTALVAWGMLTYLPR